MELNLDMKVADIEYDRYVEDMELLVRKSMNKTASVKIVSTTKNNGIVKKGLYVDEGMSNINPHIYLEEIYEHQKEKGAILKDAVDDFLELYQTVRHESIPEDFFEWKYIKEHITTKVINAEWNRELLEEIPHRKVLDLAIVYQVVLEIKDSDFTTILIRKRHLEYWGITEEELQKVAEENTEKMLPAELKRISDILCEIMGIVGAETDEIDDSIYVVTNKYRMFGAVTIFYDGMLEKIGEKLQTDFVIVPSSLHEMIIIKDTYHEIDREEVTEMVKNVNGECVRIEEWLSDHSYYYSVENKQLSL